MRDYVRMPEGRKTVDGIARVVEMVWVFFLVMACCVGCITTITLTDGAAPSGQATLETDVELARTGVEGAGVAPTPVEIRSGTDLSGVGFRVRAKFSNTYTSAKPDGSSSTIIILPDPLPPVQANELIDGNGWIYRGQLLLMPGLSIGANTLFMAAVLGVQGDVVHLDLSEADTGNYIQGISGNGGHFGFPLGLHGEFTIAQWVTPFVTWTHVFNVATWGSGMMPAAMDENITQVGLKVWPGLAGLWLEAGYIWANYSGGLVGALLLFDMDVDINGPYGGIGYRF